MKHHPLWSHGLAERLSTLNPETLRIAYIAPKPDFGTFRYRCFNPVVALNTYSRDISASYFFYSDLEIIDDLSDYADILVAIRTPYSAPINQLFRRFRNRGKPVFFDIDDLVFDTRYASLVASNLGDLLEESHLNQWTAFIANVGIALGMSDGVITTNDYLAERIRDFSDLPVAVVPNTFNSTQAEASLHHKGPRTSPGTGLNVGYFSGSSTHSQDFDVVTDSLASFLDKSSNSHLTIVGHLEIPRRLKPFSSRITQMPFMDFAEMQRVLGSINLNIVPLQTTPFTYSKSELKFFEAALVGTPTLATSTPVFANAINNGQTGFLTDNTGWEPALLSIADLEPEKLEKIGEAARGEVHKSYSPQFLANTLTKYFTK